MAKHVYLIGFSGSGKSTAGQILARLTGRRFADIDALIEDQLGASISEIFQTRGEEAFRRAESEVIREWSSSTRPAVIAVGGGAFSREQNRSVMRRTGIVVWLQCSQREIYRRTARSRSRPLLGSGSFSALELRARIRNLLHKRLAQYRLADMKVSTTNMSPRKTAQRILRKLKEV